MRPLAKVLFAHQLVSVKPDGPAQAFGAIRAQNSQGALTVVSDATVF